VTADLTRYDDVIAWLTEMGATDPDVRAIWLCGSAVTGGYDEWSDLDVELLATAGTHVATYQRLLTSYGDRFAPSSVWQLPATVAPGTRQFISVIDADPGQLTAPTRIVDLVVKDLSDAARTVDVVRHGRPLVVHDPDALVRVGPESRDDQRTAIAETIEQTRQRREVGHWLVNRAIARGQLPEAVSLYLRFALTPVVQLLRIRDCPERHDYGLRYLHTDLSPADAARVDALLPGVERLRALSDDCFAWQDGLLAEVEGR
jgi:hypothetical protein